MWQWLVETLRSNPEIAIFPDPRARFLGWQAQGGQLQPGGRDQHPAGGCAGGPARDHHLRPCEVHLLSDVPVRGRLRRRSAVLPRAQGRWHPAGAVRSRAVRGGTAHGCRASASCSAMTPAAPRACCPVPARSPRCSAWPPTASTSWASTAAEKQAMLDAMPVAYAVTYLFGTAGSAWILATLGPKILRRGYRRGVPQVRGRDGRRVGRRSPTACPATRTFVLRAYG